VAALLLVLMLAAAWGLRSGWHLAAFGLLGAAGVAAWVLGWSTRI
jgi:hypothetical protein